MDLVAEMMKDLVNKLKLDMEPVSNCVDPSLLNQEVLFKYNFHCMQYDISTFRMFYEQGKSIFTNTVHPNC